MNETIQVNRENAIKAYNNANKEQKELLEALFGKDTFKPQDICDRVKTFEDAYEILGTQHPLCKEYVSVINASVAMSPDIISYLKLRIITLALNEGWKPKFTKGEHRWYGWYDLLTKEQYDQLPNEAKCRAVLRSHNVASAYGGLVEAYSFGESSYLDTSYGSRLAFKSEKLAIYAAQQFIEIYADLSFIPKAE